MALKPARRTRRLKTPPGRYRLLNCELLECRRLLVAEGAEFSLSTSLAADGLAGQVSAVVDWGDGTQSNVAIADDPTSAPLRIRFDYSLDSGNFFGGANTFRRDLLNRAAEVLTDRLADDLAAIRPVGKAEWIPSIFHPSIGNPSELSGIPISLPKNLTIAANEIVVYAGARDLPGGNRGVAGPGTYSFPVASGTSAEIEQILAFRDTVIARGEAGGLANPQTDIGPWGGSLSFDSQTDWYFGLDPDGIGKNQSDFLTVATHELAHILGFGIEFVGATSSWDRLTSGGFFTGPKARAAFAGAGNVPVSDNHWDASVLTQFNQPTLMAGSIPIGSRQLMTALDFAALDDIGWELTAATAPISAKHRYPDDGFYDIQVTLRGSRLGAINVDTARAVVTNVSPTLTVPADTAGLAGRPLTISNLGVLTDPGFDNPAARPATQERFSYQVNWGDGSPPITGTASVDVMGNATGRLTQASFNGSHTYSQPGNYQVTVQVSDDDGGRDSKQFVVRITSPPTMTLQLNKFTIDEDAGANAAQLTIRRSDATEAISVKLTSSDTTEAAVPGSVELAAGQREITVPVDAVDDTLLDGNRNVSLIAQSSGFDPVSIALVVRDREHLAASLNRSELIENRSAASLTITRSNTDNGDPLQVALEASPAAQLTLPSSIVIPAGQPSVVVPITAADDSLPEPPQSILLRASADGYQNGETTLTLLDDERPRYQNPIDRFDVNADAKVSALDALLVVNAIGRLGGPPSIELSGELAQDDPRFDVSGDYRLSALDALQVINEVTRRSLQTLAAVDVVRGLMAPAAVELIDEALKDDELWFGIFGPAFTTG